MTVFEDLWAKGLCVAGGSNFGADYVVYDGEPCRLPQVRSFIKSRFVEKIALPALGIY